MGPRLNGIRGVLPRRGERKQSPIPVWREEKPRLRAEGTRPSPLPANSPISTPRVLQVGATHLGETSDPSPPSPGRVPDLSLVLNHQLEVFMCVCVCAPAHTYTCQVMREDTHSTRGSWCSGGLETRACNFSTCRYFSPSLCLPLLPSLRTISTITKMLFLSGGENSIIDIDLYIFFPGSRAAGPECERLL